MIRSYRQFSGQNLGRLAALSDGIFAVAMTLLILNVHVPTASSAHTQQLLWAGDALRSEASLWNALVPLAPQLLTYFMSFLTLGIFWAAQQTQLNHFTRSDHRLTWIHLTYLLAVVLMPFSTAVLAGFITYRLAMLVYWINLLLLGVLLFVSLRYAAHAGLLSKEATRDVIVASERRIVVYQLLYAAASALSVINTYLALRA